MVKILKDEFMLPINLHRIINSKIESNSKTDLEYNDIVGVELTPWHSTNFSEMVNTAKADNIWQYVLKPCIEFSKNIEQGCFKSDKKSIVIAKGSVLKKILSEKNFLEPSTLRALSNLEKLLFSKYS